MVTIGSTWSHQKVMNYISYKDFIGYPKFKAVDSNKKLIYLSIFNNFPIIFLIRKDKKNEKKDSSRH